MEKILSGNIWKQAKKYYGHDEPKIACVAYIHTTGIDLQNGDLLICDASKTSIAFGRTSAKVLKEYFERGVTIYSHEFLHAKMLHTPSVLVLGSANLSASSETDLTEAAIVTDNLILCGHAKILCNKIMKEATRLSAADIQRFLQIKVIRRPRAKKTTKRKNIEIKGNNCWYTLLSELSEQQQQNLDRQTKAQSATVSGEKNIPLDQLGKIRLYNKSAWVKQIQRGDQVISRFTNLNRTRIWMTAPVTVLSIGSVGKGKFTVLYYDLAEDEYLPWSTFIDKVKGTHLASIVTGRTKRITRQDAEQLKRLVLKK